MQKVAAVLDSHKDLEDLDKTGFEGEAEVEAFLKNRMPLNFNELNAELSTLKTELEEFKAKEEANKKREEEVRRCNSVVWRLIFFNNNNKTQLCTGTKGASRS